MNLFSQNKPVRSEEWIRKLHASEKQASELGQACSNDGSTVDHGTLLTNKETYIHVHVCVCMHVGEWMSVCVYVSDCVCVRAHMCIIISECEFQLVCMHVYVSEWVCGWQKITTSLVIGSKPPTSSHRKRAHQWSLRTEFQLLWCEGSSLHSSSTLSQGYHCQLPPAENGSVYVFVTNTK